MLRCGLQSPDRSGLLSGVRGAGAVRFGLPSAVLGIPGVLKLSHCADSEAGSSHKAVAIMVLCIKVLLPSIVSACRQPPHRPTPSPSSRGRYLWTVLISGMVQRADSLLHTRSTQ